MSNMTAEATPSAAILQKVHTVRTLMIAVGTRTRRIEEAEAEYTELRSQIAAGLRGLAISDPNVFHSLWDWYSYWKEHGLTTYQSRRAYMTSLFKPVIETLEAAQVEKPQGGSTKADQAFSIRHGYASTDALTEITIREELPQEVRDMIIDIMTQLGWDSDDLFDIAARIGKQSWQSPEPKQSGISSRVQLQRLVSEMGLVFGLRLGRAPIRSHGKLGSAGRRTTGRGFRREDQWLLPSRGCGLAASAGQDSQPWLGSF